MQKEEEKDEKIVFINRQRDDSGCRDGTSCFGSVLIRRSAGERGKSKSKSDGAERSTFDEQRN